MVAIQETEETEVEVEEVEVEVPMEDRFHRHLEDLADLAEDQILDRVDLADLAQMFFRVLEVVQVEEEGVDLEQMDHKVSMDHAEVALVHPHREQMVASLHY
jgi:hypothetical protein